MYKYTNVKFRFIHTQTCKKKYCLKGYFLFINCHKPECIYMFKYEL